MFVASYHNTMRGQKRVTATEKPPLPAVYERVRREAKRRENLPMPWWVADIVCEVADRVGANERVVLSRDRRLGGARVEIYARTFAQKSEHPGLTYAVLGRWFDRDPTTIHNGITQHKKRGAA